jgi:hypothetical protein
MNCGRKLSLLQIICVVRWLVEKPSYINTSRTQRKNQWIGGIASKPAPKYSVCKTQLGNFWPQFLRINTAVWSFIVFQKAKPPSYQCRVLLCSVDAIEGKPPLKDHQGAFFLHDNAPAYQAFATHKKPTYQCLDHQLHSPNLTPSDYNILPGLQNN